eukprot:TRINITY_DN13924_c0_g1_i5.p3 TRINITY_DN13924_c0_g1~~TRINITY_DN13924_c0_g1_i5.p3  ORF type:complete len:135 (+),score=40.09 TRINITY_DN13924_c0_g1_i5:145-549(+)
MIANSRVSEKAHKAFRGAGVSSTLASSSKSRRSQAFADVAVGSADDLLKEKRKDLDLSRLSLVVVDDPELEDMKAARRLLELLPKHQWGQTFIWTRSATVPAPLLEAYAADPVVLQGAHNVFGAAFAHEVFHSI